MGKHEHEHRGRTVRRIGVAATAIAFSVGATGAVDAGSQRSFHGLFRETAVGAGLGYDLHGTAKMTITSLGTVVNINVAGLDPEKDYASHLHNGTCASGGGLHYQHTEGGGTTPPNELWLTTSYPVMETNPGGAGHATGSATWIARTTGSAAARSVVVHEPAMNNPRIACADLR